MKRNKLLAAMLLATACSPLFAQVKVGDNPATINASAVMDIESTTKGILFPRVALTATTAFAPLAAHVAGMQVYNTATAGDVSPGNYYNDGTQWVRLVTSMPEATQLFGSEAPTGTCTAGTMYNDTLETSATTGQQWTCAGGVWTAYVAPSSTPFYINGTTNDAGASKSAVLSRLSNIILRIDNNRQTILTANGGIRFLRNSAAPDPYINGFVDFTNELGILNKFRIAMRTDPAFGTGGALALQTGGLARMVVSANGRIGIGTTNPQALLHVKGSIMGADDDYTGILAQGTGSKDGYHFTNIIANNDVYGVIQSSGINLYLTKKTATNGDKFTNFAVNGASVGSISRTAAGIAFNTTSDKRLKENIKGTHFGIQDLMKIHVADYNFISDKAKLQTTGFIAQELYKIFPDAVTVGGDNVKENPWTVDYGKVTPLLVKAIQDQQEEIAALKAQLNEMNTLKAEVASIKQLLLGKTEGVLTTLSK